MSALVWAIVVLVGVPVTYASLCVACLLYVRLPDDTPFAALEDVILLLTLPFIAALLGVTLLGRRG